MNEVEIIMKRMVMIVAMASGVVALSGCGGKGDDKLGEQAQEAMENRADAMDAKAENMTGTAEDMMEAKADATREAGAAKEKAIDDSDINADKLSAEQKANIINGM